MVAVIADDFTGAAELGGIGLCYGLSVEIGTVINATTNAQLLVIDADTRSVKKDKAVEKIKDITKNLMPLQPEWIYKKTDSVLRGHVVAELEAQMKLTGKQSALLVPANPNLGRTIKNGIYFFDDQPVHQSSFSNDPEFAITSSSIQDMLKAPVQMATLNGQLPASGIIVGEVSEMKDLDEWAAKWRKDILPAGAAGFFSAILQSKMSRQPISDITQEQASPVLYVSGTTFKKSSEAIQKIKAAGGPVSYQPSNDILELIQQHGKAIIAIDPAKQLNNAVQLREETAQIVEKVLKQIDIREIFIEGGSTARAIFNRLNFRTFFPVQELSTGVVRLKVKEREGLAITVKPGSYAWPQGTWPF